MASGRVQDASRGFAVTTASQIVVSRPGGYDPATSSCLDILVLAD